MAFGEEQRRAHLERQQRLGKTAPSSPPAPSVSAIQARVIQSLERQVAELSAKLQAKERQESSALVPPTRIKPIISAVAKYYGFPLTELVSFRRSSALIRPRQVAMYLARRLTKHSLPAIGRVFDRDHTTILHGCRQIERRRQEDINLDAEIRELIERLASGTPAENSKQESVHAKKKTEEIDHAPIGQRDNGS